MDDHAPEIGLDRFIVFALSVLGIGVLRKASVDKFLIVLDSRVAVIDDHDEACPVPVVVRPRVALQFDLVYIWAYPTLSSELVSDVLIVLI